MSWDMRLKNPQKKAEPMICDDCFHNTVCRLDGNEVLEWCSARVPSADVVRVKHGEWIENDNGTYSCSICNSWIPNEQHYYARYCLHCGADMRGETE